jgi:hypothetical protein
MEDGASAEIRQKNMTDCFPRRAPRSGELNNDK